MKPFPLLSATAALLLLASCSSNKAPEREASSAAPIPQRRSVFSRAFTGSPFEHAGEREEAAKLAEPKKDTAAPDAELPAAPEPAPIPDPAPAATAQANTDSATPAPEREKKRGFFNRLFGGSDESTSEADSTTAAPPKTQEKPAAPVPSEAQQAAARQLAPSEEIPIPSPAAAPEPAHAETAGDNAFPGLKQGGLRLGNFAPPEEAASSSESSAPSPNSVDLHGLRSPKLPNKLPMNINGKLNNENAD